MNISNNKENVNKKVKTFPPSLREKRRYLLLKGCKNFNEIVGNFMDFVGIKGFSKANLKLIDSFDDFLLIRINTSSINDLRASLVINNKKIKIIKVFGTIKNYENYKNKNNKSLN